MNDTTWQRDAERLRQIGWFVMLVTGPKSKSWVCNLQGSDPEGAEFTGEGKTMAEAFRAAQALVLLARSAQ